MIFPTFINWLNYVKGRALDNNLNGFVWLLDLGPKSVGFSLVDDKRDLKFWLFHFSLVFYGYFLGSIHYQIVRESNDMTDFVKLIINMSIIMLTITSSYWYLTNRDVLMTTLGEMAKSEKLAILPETMADYRKYTKTMKIVLVFYYFIHIFNGVFFYFPNRLSFKSNLGVTSCVGMSLDTDLQKVICRVLLISQEFTISTTILNYQALLLFLFGHTYITFYCLTKSIPSITKKLHEPNAVSQNLSLIIERHVLILRVVERLRSLYKMPIGLNFGVNFLLVCFFFYVPLTEYFTFLPILTYCITIFYFYCFLCQKLIDASEEFERAIYNCGWESFGVKERKIVYTMLFQAQKPVTFLAADIIPLNAYTFARIVQNIYKFVTVVKF